MKVMERSPDITVSSARGGGNAEQGWIYAFEYRGSSCPPDRVPLLAWTTTCFVSPN